MDYLNIFQWVISTSIIASILALIIFLCRHLIKKKVSPNTLYLLWFLVIIKLVIPYGPESNISIYNILKWDNKVISNKVNINNNLQSVLNNNELIDKENNENFNKDNNITDNQILNIQASNQEVTNTSTKDKNILNQILFILWIAGIAVISTRILISYIKLKRLIKNQYDNENKELNNILISCLNELNIKQRVEVIITNNIESPCLCGVIRPKILISKEVINSFNENELRYIFLHELCHLKRKDVVVAWLISILKAVYWFNPIIILSLNTMQNDCELCCDNMVLSYLNTEENLSYGNTIINILKHVNKPMGLVGSTSMAINKEKLKERISMIAKNKTFTIKNLFLGLIIIVLIGAIGLTSKVKSENKEIMDVFLNKLINDETYESISKPQGSKFAEDCINTFNEYMTEEGLELLLANRVPSVYANVLLRNYDVKNNEIKMNITKESKNDDYIHYELEVSYKLNDGNKDIDMTDYMVMNIINIDGKELINDIWVLNDTSSIYEESYNIFNEDISSVEPSEYIGEDITELYEEEAPLNTFGDYVREKGFTVIMNSGLGGHIKIPDSFDESINGINFGEIFKKGNEKSKGYGLDFSSHLGEIVKFCSFSVENKEGSQEVIGLFDKDTIIGFWETDVVVADKNSTAMKIITNIEVSQLMLEETFKAPIQEYYDSTFQNQSGKIKILAIEEYYKNYLVLASKDITDGEGRLNLFIIDRNNKVLGVVNGNDTINTGFSANSFKYTNGGTIVFGAISKSEYKESSVITVEFINDNGEVVYSKYNVLDNDGYIAIDYSNCNVKNIVLYDDTMTSIYTLDDLKAMGQDIAKTEIEYIN